MACLDLMVVRSEIFLFPDFFLLLGGCLDTGEMVEKMEVTQLFFFLKRTTRKSKKKIEEVGSH